MYDFIFRFDANEKVGAGHFQRVLALIQPLSLRSHSIACIGDVSPIFRNILSEYDVDIFHIRDSMKCRCLVVDHYDSFEVLLSQELSFSKLMVIEDIEGRSSERANLVVNALGCQHSLELRYPNATVLTGLEFLAFRKELTDLKLRNIEQSKNLSVKSILVSLGGTDQSESILRICSVLESIVSNNLLENTQGIEVTIQSPVDINLPDGVHLKSGYDPDFIANSTHYDIVICGAGQTFLELSYLGLDVIGVVLVENQVRCADLLSTMGADALKVDIDFETKLFELLSDRLLRSERRGIPLIESMAKGSSALITNMVALLR